MNPVYALGFKLAELTKQKPSAGIGLLCLALRDAGKNTSDIDIQDFKDVFEHQLPVRLEMLQITNHEQIIGELSQMLAEDQSVFSQEETCSEAPDSLLP